MAKETREKMTLFQVMEKFPNNQAAEQWFKDVRWKGGRFCPHCGSYGTYEVESQKPQPYRCKDCKKYFSLKTGTIMQGSRLGYRVWALAFYLMSTSVKGVSSLKLHRDLGVAPLTAWHLVRRIRETWINNSPAGFSGEVEVDEAYLLTYWPCLWLTES